MNALTTITPPAKPIDQVPVVARRTFPLALIGLLIAWVGCYCQWTTTRGAAFSVNIFDLAEWTSLDAVIRYGSPSLPLLPTFLLRLTVGLLAFAIAVQAIRAQSAIARRLLIALALVITIGLLPPFGNLKIALSDINYRQQLIIAVITSFSVIAIWLLAARVPKRVIMIGGIVLPIATLLLGSIGWLMAVNALSVFQIHLAPGVGLFIFAIGLLVSIASGILQRSG